MKKIKKLLMGVICPSCKNLVDMKFNSIQPIKDKEPLLFYDCSKCESTLALETIKKYNHHLKA